MNFNGSSAGIGSRVSAVLSALHFEETSMRRVLALGIVRHTLAALACALAGCGGAGGDEQAAAQDSEHAPLAALTPVAGASAQQPDPSTVRYDVIYLGSLGGTSPSGPETGEAFAINERGELAGYSISACDNTIHAFLYSNGRMIDLGTLGGSISAATAINESGQVVGWSYNSNNESRAFLYSDGRMTHLGTLGGAYSTAKGINDTGQVVGYAGTSNNVSHAFLYSNGSMVDLGTLGGPSSLAHAINNSGQVVGRAERPGTDDTRPFLYSDGKMSDLGSLNADFTFNNEATAINDSGQVVGFSQAIHARFAAFLYSNGNLTEIDPSSDLPSVATGINSSGQIVGYRYSAGNRIPFLYSNGKLVLLRDLLAQNLGWQIHSANAINDAGDIAASGCNASLGHLCGPLLLKARTLP
jgi:probable HAF family extracellular repeat protein